MGGSYYEGSYVDPGEADNHGASWTADELAFLRDKWRRMSLRELAEVLGRTEGACQGQYYHQLNRPLHERWQPPRYRNPISETRDVQPERPVRTIHEDEDRWWEADYYRTG